MRLALCSTAFNAALRDGELTQLEIFEYCARRLPIDGIVLDIAHFPRHDDEYVAQIKKFSADLALSIVAVRDDQFTSRRSNALVLAAGVGAPYVLTRMPESGTDPVLRYNEALGAISHAVVEAKRVNVTLAVRNVRGSLASDATELSRLRKEADSAWLQYALDPAAFEGPPDAKLRTHAVLVFRAVDQVPASGEDPSAEAILGAVPPAFPGFLCLDYLGPAPEADATARLVAGWQRLLARRVLEQGVAEPHVPS